MLEVSIIPFSLRRRRRSGSLGSGPGPRRRRPRGAGRGSRSSCARAVGDARPRAGPSPRTWGVCPGSRSRLSRAPRRAPWALGVLPPERSLPHRLRRLPRRRPRSPGHALTCAALETWPGRRGDAQTQTPSHWPARLRFRGPPSRGRGGAAGASQRACASRVSRINWTQRKGQRNEKEIKRRFTTTVKNLQSGAGMEFHATEPAPTGPRGQAGPFLPAARESRPPSRPALSP